MSSPRWERPCLGLCWTGPPPVSRGPCTGACAVSCRPCPRRSPATRHAHAQGLSAALPRPADAPEAVLYPVHCAAQSHGHHRLPGVGLGSASARPPAGAWARGPHLPPQQLAEQGGSTSLLHSESKVGQSVLTPSPTALWARGSPHPV